MPSFSSSPWIRGAPQSRFSAQSENLEQQVSTRRQGEPDCRDCSEDATHGGYNGQLPRGIK